MAVPERSGPDGVLRQLDEDALRARARGLGAAEAAAVCLLWGFRHPDHERRVPSCSPRRCPDVHVSTSHETAACSASTSAAPPRSSTPPSPPSCAATSSGSPSARGDAGLPVPEVMLSSGGVAERATAARHGSWTVLSGPAGGAVGRRARGAAAGTRVGLDMGGTSCDVSLSLGRRAWRSAAAARWAAARWRCRWSTCTRSARAAAPSPGATRAARCAWARARRAPTPGRPATGAAATEPTVTDANLMLGYLDAGSPLAGGVRARPRGRRAGAWRARRGARPGARSRRPPGSCAWPSAEMAQAVRVMTVERGIDPRELALLPFGGAGPLHAAAIAEELGMRRVIVPARVGRAVGAGARGVGAPARPRGERAAVRRRRSTAEAVAAVVERLGRRAAARSSARREAERARPSTCATRARRSS